MKYDFDNIPNRRGTYSVKWNVLNNELPMWVADMDFETAPVVKEAILKVANHGVYGYSDFGDDYFNAYIYHWNTYHNTKLTKDDLIYCSGVISSLDIILKYLCKKGDNAILLTPVYNTFFNCIRNNGLNLLECELTYRNSAYSINFADLEEKLSLKETTIMVLCNPHNPIGKIWDKEDIIKVAKLCEKYNVLLVSDEIHCDIASPGYSYNAVYSIDEIDLNNVIALVSPSKVFNLAGLQSACIICRNKKKHDLLQKCVYSDDVGEPNIFAISANVKAYTKGDDWVKELNSYIENNRIAVKNYLETNIPNFKLIEGHATYLLWIDISASKLSSEEFVSKLRKETGLFVLPGSKYGKAGEGFIRMNVATSRKNVDDALNRLSKFSKTLF